MAVSTLSSSPSFLACNKCLFAVLVLVTTILVSYYVHVGSSTPGIVHPSQIAASTIALLQDMKKCSRAMNISEETMKHAATDLKAIAKNAGVFLNAIWSIVPRKFSSKYKNPCWHSDLVLSRDNRSILYSKLNSEKRNYLTEELVTSLTDSIFKQKHSKNVTSKRTTFCLPYFFIAGFPKSATSLLDDALRRHSKIVGPRCKEPHWWTRMPLQFSNFNYLKLSVLRYLMNFHSKRMEVDVITYDSSQSTLWDSNFFVHHQDYCAMPAVLSRVLPNAKFIVLMRNPVIRLYSHYLYSCTQRYGKTVKWPKRMRQHAAANFHREVVADVENFRGCMIKRSLYECVNNYRFRSNTCGGVGARMTIGLYHVHLSKWLQFYPRDQFLFLRMEDISTDPHSLVTKITDFLGVAPVSPSQAEQWFSKRVNVHNTSSEGSTQETRELLEQFYRPYNAMLAELTGDSRFKWEE